MTHAYVPVTWNARKVVYDLCVFAGVVGYLAAFLTAATVMFRGEDAISTPILLMRAFSTCAFLMLTVILCIGPLARLDRRFLPLLYNRRHFGVALFIVALLHAAVAIYWYHGFGVVNPIFSVFLSGGGLPFQALGALALAILFVMAATSHDFWNATLGGALWKSLHMLVYVAYGLVVAHIIFGALQQDNTGVLPWMAVGGVALVGGLHLAAAFCASGADWRLRDSGGSGDWVTVGNWRDIPNNRAVTVAINADERIAIFRYDDNKLAAVSNVCQHQNGPLGEGRVIDGLITCPWHGYQYRPEDGCSPPPFTEKIGTYRLKLDGEELLVSRVALVAGSKRAVLTVT